MENKQLAGNKCSLPYCRRSKRDFPDLKLFKFPPVQSPMFFSWVEKCGFTEEFVAKSANLFLCDRHFCPEDIGKRKLKLGTVPKFFSEGENVRLVEYEHSDLDLTLLRPPTRKRKRSVSPASRCVQCHKNMKAVSYYQAQNRILNKKLHKKQEKIKALRNENIKFKRANLSHAVKFEKKEVDASVVDTLDVSQNEKILVKMLLKTKRGKGSSWTIEEKLFAQTICYRSTSTYLFLRDVLGLHLPSPTSLRRWNTIKHLQPGDNECLYEAIINVTRTMQPFERECNLAFDEVAIKKNITYNIATDSIDGVEDYGNRRSDKLGSHIIVFMVRGLFSRWKFILNYYVSETCVKAEILQNLVKKNLDLAKRLNLSIRSTSCDQGSNNRKYFKLLGASADKPFFYIMREKYIFCMMLLI